MPGGGSFEDSTCPNHMGTHEAAEEAAGVSGHVLIVGRQNLSEELVLRFAAVREQH